MSARKTKPSRTLDNGGAPRWRIHIKFENPFAADLFVHVHTPNGQALKSASLGNVERDRVVLAAATLAGKAELTIDIRSEG